MYYLYKITNLINLKKYIGQTDNIKRRWKQHKKAALKNKPGQIIHYALIKYGLNNFNFEHIATCKTLNDANEIETFLVSQYESHISTGKGYNVSLGGSNAPKTEEWCQKMSIIMKQKFKIDETLLSHLLKEGIEYREYLKMNNLPFPGAFQIGHEVKPEWIEASKLANTRRIHSQEEIKKRTDAIIKYYENHDSYWLGAIFSEEHRQNISKSLTGLKRTEETKQKMRDSNNTAWFKTGHNINKRKYSPKDEYYIAQLYDFGFTTHQLSNDFNLDRTSIKRILIEHNIIIRSKEKFNEQQKEEIIKLYNSGIKYTTIAKKFNVDKSTIKRILPLSNIKENNE